MTCFRFVCVHNCWLCLKLDGDVYAYVDANVTYGQVWLGTYVHSMAEGGKKADVVTVGSFRF